MLLGILLGFEFVGCYGGGMIVFLILFFVDYDEKDLGIKIRLKRSS